MFNNYLLENTFIKKYPLGILVCILILLAIIMNPTNLTIYAGDDEDYLAHATAIVFGEFPDYSKEKFNSDKPGYTTTPTGIIGISFLSLPFVYFFSRFDYISNSTIFINRNHIDLSSTWTAYGFWFSTQFYFFLSTYLSYNLIKKKGSIIALVTIFLMVISQGILHYVYKRPIFTPVYEFFLHILFLSLLFLSKRPLTKRPFSYLLFFFIGIFSTLVYLTRLYNLHFSILYSIFYLLINRAKGFVFSTLIKSFINIFFVSIGVFLSFLILRYIPFLYSIQNSGITSVNENIISGNYGKISSVLALNNDYLNLDYLTKFFKYFIFGYDAGLFFTAPFLIISIITIPKIIKEINIYLLLLILGLSVNLYVVVFATRGPASVYGWRYIVFTAIPLLSLPFATFIQSLSKSYRYYILAFLIILSIIPNLGYINFLKYPIPLTENFIDKSPTYRNPEYFKILIFDLIYNSKKILYTNNIYNIQLFLKSERFPNDLLHSDNIKYILNILFPFILIIFDKTKKNIYAKQ